MPLYEYVCSACAADFEVLVRGQEEPECPECGGRKLEKQMSVAAAHSNSTRSLPVCPPEPRGGGCGLPQCGSGGCFGGG